jgi:large subunit ribosomal protein L25
MKNIKEKEQIKLNAEKRTIFGKKLKKLRKENKIPANIYGQNFASTAIFVSQKDFINIYHRVQKTGIIYLKLDTKEIPVIISQIQLHPINHQILHIDFRKVDLKQKLITEVPIKIINQSPAVEQKGGYLLVNKEKLQIEAFPQSIPSEILIDISSLIELNQEIKVNQIKINGDYEIKNDPETTVVTVIPHKEETTESKEAKTEETSNSPDNNGEDTSNTTNSS